MHSMEWGDLRIFLAAVRAGSYSAAALELGINRTTIGRRVASLEAALGLTLFRDTPSGHEPTEDGRLLLESAARVEAEIADLERRLGSGVRRPTRIRIASSAGIATEFLAELGEFQQQRPDVTLELLGALDPIEAVSDRKAELAIALVRNPPLRLAGVQVATLSQAPYARRDCASDRQLGWGQEMEAALPGQWTAANPTGAWNPAKLTSLNNWPQLKQAAIAGMGRAWLWCFAADREPSLERLAAPDRRWDSSLWLLHWGGAPPAPALADLIVFLDEILRRRIGE
jgi:DNA-binding transcriptional LysR family regulator